MRDVTELRARGPLDAFLPGAGELEQMASELCEKALNVAKSRLHPLLRNSGLDRLDQRREFLEAFKGTLEQKTAQKLAAWQPNIQTIFTFDQRLTPGMEDWDGSIYLLAKVPRLSHALEILGQTMDENLLRCLRQLGWSRFQKSASVLELQQVTAHELRYGIGYGAMFFAVYTVPVRVWPRDRQAA